MQKVIFVGVTPKSFNNKNSKEALKEIYLNEFKKHLRPGNPYYTYDKDIDLYGIIYFFTRDSAKLGLPDADNIPKVIWDSMKQHLFVDDKQIKLSICGIISLSADYEYVDIDIKDIELLNAISSNDKVLYLECGKVDKSLYKIRLEKI